MKYINKDVFKYYDYEKASDVETEQFGWILTGVPTIDTLGHGKDDSLKASYDDAGYEGYCVTFDKEKGHYMFYDSYIAGYSNVLSDAINFYNKATDDNDNELISADESLKITMTGSTAATINLAVDLNNSNRYGWKNTGGCYLFFVKYKDDLDFTTGDPLGDFFKDIFVADSNNNSNSNVYYYKPTKELKNASLTQLENTIKEGKNFINNFVDKVYIAYNVNTNSIINAYNFSGFSVGESSLSISGFYES